MKSKHFLIPVVGGAIVIALWLLFRNSAAVASSNQPDTASSGLSPASGSGTVVNPTGVAPVPAVAASTGLPPQLTFNLGPQGNAGPPNVTNNQQIVGVPLSGPGAVNYPGSQMAGGGGSSCGCGGSGCGGCQDCSQSNSCALNRSNFDGAGACLAPNPKQHTTNIATKSGSQAGATPNPFSSLLNNLFNSGEGQNLSTNALQMINLGLQDAQGNGKEGFEAPANPQYQGYGASYSYNNQPTVSNIPGYSIPWAPGAPSQLGS